LPAVWQAPTVAGESRIGGRVDLALIGRLRDVVGGKPATEAELRKLQEHGEAVARLLEGRLQASEQHLDRLAAQAAPHLAEVTTELRRIEAARPQLKEVQALMGRLEERARELRAHWVRGSPND
jgi:chromosome segregation ATPase